MAPSYPIHLGLLVPALGLWMDAFKTPLVVHSLPWPGDKAGRVFPHRTRLCSYRRHFVRSVPSKQNIYSIFLSSFSLFFRTSTSKSRNKGQFWNPTTSKSVQAMSTHGSSQSQEQRVPDTEGIGEETVDQLTPHDQWAWNSEHHWKHWHGLWALWQPTESPQVVKTYKSVRSLWPVDRERVHLYHRNQWYAGTGEGPDINWENGPWAMYEMKHSLQDGIWHPNSIDHRIIQFPNGDLGWVQLALKPKDPKSIVFNELHFMASSDARAPVIVGHGFEGKIGIALMLEETREDDKRPELSWQGNIWKHHRASLEESRSEPEGTFIGTELSINTNLQLMTRKAVWKGFRGGLNEEDAQNYILIHLPYGFTAFAPREAAIGKAHAYYVSWVVNDKQVRVLSVRYFADGRLQYVKSGTYERSAETQI